MNIEVKPGYKLTETGVFPEDWEEVLLDSVAKRGSGHTPDKKHPEYWDGSIKWVSLQDSEKLDDLYINETAAKITQAGINNSSAVLHSAGSVILSRDAGVGKSSIILDKMAVSQHFIAWCCGQRLDNHYLYYWMQAAKPEFERIANGSTIKTIGLPYFRELKLSLPSLAEQKNIAAALMDIDGFIRGLIKLIAKKRDIKQAAMQQLLTGQHRLPGFSGEWEIKRLGEVLEKIVGGGTPSRSNEKYWHGEIPWVTVKDFATFNPRSAQETITQEGLKNSSSNFIPSGTLITSTRMALGKAVIYEVGVCINQDLKALFPKTNVCTKFLYYWFENNAATIDELGSGSTVKGISLGDLKAITFLLSSLEEQTAIATILSDMDNELTGLESRRDKARQIKQGMMQELMTGKTRIS